MESVQRAIPKTHSGTSAGWCSIGNPVFAYVQHTNTHLTIFVRSAEADGPVLASLLPPEGSPTLSKRVTLGSAWARSTPYFLKIATKDEAIAALPVLLSAAKKLSSSKRRGAVSLPSEDEIVDHWEGNRALVYVNRYERDARTRAACIRFFGVACSVCGFEFGRVYGDIGNGFIHVHHLAPLSMAGKAHRVDPKKDLRPVCPNCHEMLHRRSPPFTIDELKARVRAT
jgi:predicted HNH restriction endonuclease